LLVNLVEEPSPSNIFFPDNADLVIDELPDLAKAFIDIGSKSATVIEAH
jgi:hypothetical protein